MEPSPENWLKDGWLIKVGIFKATWRRRHFVLQGGPLLGRIDYYKKEQKVWKGAITLTKVEEPQLLDTAEDLGRLIERITQTSSDVVLSIPKIRELPKDHHFFAIKTTSRLWVLGAKTLEERAQWVTAITDVIHYVNGPESSVGICASSPQAWSKGSVPRTRSQVLQAAPSAGIGRRGSAALTSATAGGNDASSSSSASAASAAAIVIVSDYLRTDPDGDKARISALGSVFKEFVEREKAFKRESMCEVVPLGRLSAMDPARVEDLERALEASRIYAAWAEQLYAYALRLTEARCDRPGPAGPPVVAFADEQTPDPCSRDLRYLLIVLSEALEKAISACDRRCWAAERSGNSNSNSSKNNDNDESSENRECDNAISLEKTAELCAKILGTSVKLLRSLAGTDPVEALASGTHKRLGEESPVRSITPELAKVIAQWTLPALAAQDEPQVAAMERPALAQLGAERAFLSKHIHRILSAGPVRFGFLNVRFPAEDANNFAKLAGKAPDCAYDSELPEGRLYCELSDEALCFTTSAKGDEVVVPLLWIRKLEVEATAGCFMKFTRYLEEPSAESHMETRIIYGDNTAETFAWLTDITRIFLLRRHAK